MNAKSRFGEALQTGGDCTAKISQGECEGQAEWRYLLAHFRCGTRCVAAAYTMNNGIIIRKTTASITTTTLRNK